MFSSLGTKIGTKLALQKAGLSNVSLPSFPSTTTSKSDPSNSAQQSGVPNPFANVQLSVPKAFSSWQTPPPPPNGVRTPPVKGEKAQSNPKLPFPTRDGRPVMLLFLRYCGCPFTEKLFLTLRHLSNRHPQISFIAVSHCTPAATEAWVKRLGGAWNVSVIVDESRELYALWGLGISNWGHLLNPRNGYNQILLGKKEGVWGSAVGEGGCRWQVGGAYAVDERGVVQWGGPMGSVDEQIQFEEGIKALGVGGRPGVF
ncbi:uncharacterized protein EI97DRAFT_47534 [Westerdykella ornata]|uniref:Thioredoxin domain-containing protein n=1 Tax=Westerdykella ornata TaxID=318751 RepID=A0A6A6JJB3_WESOR|nr:uncharacterized protein EI97DRAFT_47534 [Westerdykella ornata]KAF2276068.1 hypothetical protein EI97DRAFT_47534 [Westerdykella ornata]